MDALFAPAGQDRRAMEHRPQDPGPRRRAIDWRLDDRGALEARLGNVFNEHPVCNSKLICSLECVSGRYEVRAAPRIDLSFASLLCRAGARRNMLVLTLILANVLSIRSWSGAIASLHDLSARRRTYLSCTFAQSHIVVMCLGPPSFRRMRSESWPCGRESCS